MRKMGLYYSVFCIMIAACNSKTPSVNKTLIVKEIEFDGVADFQNVSRLLDEHAETHFIDVLNWDDFQYQPKIGFKIAHCNNQLWLKYEVEEENILAERTEPNSYVFKDSCVEFFFDPMADGNYYNFEINCIGTILLAHGPSRKSRQYASPNTIKDVIKVESSLGAQSFTEKTGGHTWEITIILPAEILAHNPGIKLKGLKSRANFYKCGDATSKRHYLSWNPIGTEKPDFHRPEFFGELIFE
ncbi:carbohydrate-binding family 9-like protein [Flagellimonas pacifica]|uniref:Carbohydrate-binding family 9 n=1 Tax=Flagellimonas pacifica TaxID=1247520 RepID=A0A285MBJ2_9FLAO|nr:carbohydrate-binding family 9-like protein [Allomuricauda parva]SNY94509.1 Carbohydrate-binding family 9 [Allomuricauda parva]